jgi:hypothetical protein
MFWDKQAVKEQERLYEKKNASKPKKWLPKD